MIPPLQILKSPRFQEISCDYLQDTIYMLLEDGTEFAIAIEKEYTSFNPPLPTEIIEVFGDIVVFSIAGYSFDTAEVTDGSFSFEAGFGTENFGSVVSLPLLAIKQLFVDELPILSNMTSPTINPEPKSSKTDKKLEQKSMQALLNNPKNRELFKKNSN